VVLKANLFNFDITNGQNDRLGGSSVKPRCQKNLSQENGSLGWRPGPGELGKKGDKLIQL